MSTADKVLEVYKKVNPSTYFIETIPEEYRIRRDFIYNVYQRRLNFPIKMFSNSELIEFGCGTGEHSSFLLKWGAKGTFIDMNEESLNRAKSLFEKFEIPDENFELVHSTIEDFSSEKQYDIVLCQAVLHHVGNKQEAFKKMSSHVKDGGYFILGVGNNAGLFQVNLQRLIVNELAGDSDDQKYKIADVLFDEHISRSQKYGRRSREAIIYDTYINPKIDGLSVQEVIELYSQNGMELYSSWPPVIPGFLGDPPNREPVDFSSISNITTLSELIFSAHRNDDIELLKQLDSDLSSSVGTFKSLISTIREITPTSKIDLDSLQTNLQNCIQTLNNGFNPYLIYFEQLKSLLDEVHTILKLLPEGDLTEIKKSIESSEFLFKGTSGIGINWFIGFKNSN